MTVNELPRDLLHAPSSVRVVLDFVSAHAGDPDECLRRAGLDNVMIDDPDTGVTLADELALIRAVLSCIEDRPGLGLDLGRRYRISTYGIYGFALLSSPTLGEAMVVAERYGPLGFALGRIAARRVDRCVVWTIDSSNLPHEVARFCAEREVAASITMVRELLGRDVQPIRTGFSQDAPPDRTLFDWCGPDVSFGSAHDEVVFDQTLFAESLPQGNPATAGICLAQCEVALQRRARRSGLSEEVRNRFLRDPIRFGNMVAVAADLGLSVRTLRRQLDAERTSFRSLVAEAREALAEELLVTAGLTVEQTAARLGYHDRASFSHAFHRWKGIPAGEYQRRHRGRRVP